MSNPKKQHFVPQVYLNHFTDDSGFLHIYDRVKDEFRKQTPANAGYSKHFYTLEHNGEKDYSIEKGLATHVDNLYKPVMEKIKNKETLTQTDRENLAVFVAFQHLRTPAQRKNYNSMVDDFYKQTSKLIFSFKKAYGQLGELTEQESSALEETVENGKFDVQVPKEHSLQFMLEFSEEMSQMLSNHNFIIVEASSKSAFISSDNPYCMVKEKGEPDWSGYGIVNTAKFFPLSPRYLLVLKDPGNKVVYMKHDKATVRQLNILTAKWSDRFLYSHNEELLKGLVAKIKKSVSKN
ncbi:DUF4238 domain-containing protein [Sutcliffiella horikoshii]|uniref:DUF4238 domain-containing protein n=1 Tax=Sutcliffiella horikoshii TaxID=79883 RepID=UPI003CED3B43